MSVTLKDFVPVNTWTPDAHGEIWYHDKTPKWLIDGTTSRKYLNQSTRSVRAKCFLLALGTPLVHGIIVPAVYLKCSMSEAMSGPFYKERRQNFPELTKRTYTLQNFGRDLLRIILQPLLILGLELAVIYGIFNPYDGRKLYASLERLAYKEFRLVSCFQPDAFEHFFRGSINDKNAW